jgi:hypothetical protein
LGLGRVPADIAGQLASLKGEANSCLRVPNYDTLELRLENAHAAVGADRLNAPYRYGALAQTATAATFQLRLVGSSSIASTSTNVEKGCI